MVLAGLVDAPSAPERLKPLVEITLVWVLFSDAARIRIQEFRRDLGLYVRLLAVGLLLTVAVGWGVAGWLLPGLGIWLALLVGAALAPTDAALGIPVVTNLAVPARIRRLITVESGLNDGIVTPVVMLAIAGAAVWPTVSARHPWQPGTAGPPRQDDPVTSATSTRSPCADYLDNTAPPNPTSCRTPASLLQRLQLARAGEPPTSPELRATATGNGNPTRNAVPQPRTRP